VIGNPPYVRQEQILPPEDPVFLEKLMKPQNKVLKAKVNKEYKALLNERVYKVYPWLGSTMLTTIDGKNKTVPVYGQKVPGRADLYVYFQLLCPHYLNSKGTFCFIISNSWMDVDFGSYVQHFMLKHTKLIGVYDCNMRSFDAAVNTVIYLHGSITNIPALRSNKYSFVKPLDNMARFIMNKVDYSTAAYSKLLIAQEGKFENTFDSAYRVIPITQQLLYENGFDDEIKSFEGDKWGGKYLRAPEIYYTILSKGKGLLFPLKDLTSIDYGIKTGANEFFYLQDSEADEWGIESEYLFKVLKSPRDSISILIDRKKLDTNLFNCNQNKNLLKGTNALQYIKWGEGSEIIDGIQIREFNLRPSCRGRENWYNVPIAFGNTFWGKELRERLCVFCSDVPIVADCRLYMATLKIEQQAVLNSTFSVFIDEVLSRQLGGGGGPRSVMVYEVKNLITIDSKLMINSKELIDPFKTLRKRVVKPFIEEVGFDSSTNIRSQIPKPLPDRAALDKVIFDALGLTDDERNEVYWSVAELVQQRLNKAASR